jgi:hypothetical protein
VLRVSHALRARQMRIEEAEGELEAMREEDGPGQ